RVSGSPSRFRGAWMQGGRGEGLRAVNRPSTYYHSPMTDPRPAADWRPLALTLAGLATAYAVAYRLMPFTTSGYLLWPFGAWAMYCGARLSARVAVPLVICVLALTDLVLYQRTHYP